MVIKTMRMMNNRITKSVELLETEEKIEKIILTSRIVEAMYEQSPNFFKNNFEKNLNFLF